MEEKFMRRAIELAKLGAGAVNPNPLVGAVIVKNGKIIAEGYHAAYGELHAERSALENCSESAEGADIYVTLEPCCHTGKQPPCTRALIENGLRRVYVGSDDPNPVVNGGGIRELREHGIEVHTGILKKECDSLNRVFFHYVRTQTPYVVMKYAMTADGKIFSDKYERAITSPKAIQNVHKTRNLLTGIMTGVGTVIKDDPMLNCRIPGGRSPVRIVCDSSLRIPRDSKIIKTASRQHTIIAAANGDSKKIDELRACGAEVIFCKGKDGRVDLAELMKILGSRKIDGILLECGPRLGGAALKQGIVNSVQCYIANKIYADGISPAEGGVRVQLSKPSVTILENDVLMEYEVIKCLRA